MKYKFYLLVFLSIFFHAICLADFSGRVIKVIDGDTVKVLTDGKIIKVRLEGIDAPELGQPFSQRSKQNLLKLAAHKQATVIANNTDCYGRWLGTLIINGININAEQIKAGMAWVYRYHGRISDEKMLYLEEEVRRHKIGLWSSSNPVEPWKWRGGN